MIYDLLILFHRNVTSDWVSLTLIHVSRHLELQFLLDGLVANNWDAINGQHSAVYAAFAEAANICDSHSYLCRIC